MGDGLIFLILVALSGYMYWRAQQQKVDSNNVNADWDDSTNSVVPADCHAGRRLQGRRSDPAQQPTNRENH